MVIIFFVDFLYLEFELNTIFLDDGQQLELLMKCVTGKRNNCVQIANLAISIPLIEMWSLVSVYTYIFTFALVLQNAKVYDDNVQCVLGILNLKSFLHIGMLDIIALWVHSFDGCNSKCKFHLVRTVCK